MRPASRSRQGCGFRDFHGLKVSLGGELLCSEPGGDPPPWARICGIWFRILCDVTQPSKDPSPSLGWRLSESPLGKGSPSALRVSGLQDEAGRCWAGVQEGAGCGVWALMIPRSTGGPSPGRARIHTTHSVSQPSVQVTKPHDGGEWILMENHEVHFIFFFCLLPQSQPFCLFRHKPHQLHYLREKRHKPILGSTFLSRTSSPSVLVDFTYV